MIRFRLILLLSLFSSTLVLGQEKQFLNSIEEEAYNEKRTAEESLPKPLSLESLIDALEGRELSIDSQIEYDRLISVLGEDNLRGYVALINCDHDRAISLFKVGQLSFHYEQKLAGIWMECIAEQERRNSTKASPLYRVITEMDPSIQSPEMASMAVDRYVLNLKNERTKNQLPACTHTGGTR